MTAEDIEGFKEELQNLSNLIDDISEKSGRPTSLRENRRNLQKSLRPVFKIMFLVFERGKILKTLATQSNVDMVIRYDP